MKVFIWTNEVEPGAPCQGTCTQCLSPRTWRQIAIILCWAGRLSQTEWQVDAIGWLRRTSPDQMLALVARQQLRWEKVLVHFPCIHCGRPAICFTMGIKQKRQVDGGNALPMAYVMMGELPLPRGLLCLTTTIITANHLRHSMVQPAPNTE